MEDIKKNGEVGTGPFAGRKVLIVDDDDFLLNMYSLKFRKEGLLVEVSHGGAETIAKLKGGYTPDLMLLDVVMPAMDGLELLQNIRNEKLAEKSVVVMLTNQSQQTDIDRAKELGIQGYIIKASTIPSEVLAETLSILKAALARAS